MYAPEAAIECAPTGVAADAMRQGVIAEIRTSSSCGDELLDLLRRGAEEVAMLAAVWHEPAESFCMLLEAGAERGIPTAQVRGILIGGFGFDPTVPSDLGHDKSGTDHAFSTEARRRMAVAHEDERLWTFQRVALDCGALVRTEEILRPDGAGLLMELAQSSGLTEMLRPDTLQHVISEAFQGRSAILERSSSNPSEKKTGKPMQGRHLVMRCAADILPEPITWLWPQRIAVGKLTLIAGEPGLGKSQVLAALAAAVTMGGRWPCDEGLSPMGSVIVLSAEDDPADTQIPRLVAARADRRKVHIVSAVRESDAAGNRTFNIQADLDLVERELDRLGDVILISIDPLSSYLGKVDSHNNAEVRAVLERLSEMAARRRVAIVAVTHFSKGEGRAINKIIGSIAFAAAARAAWMVASDPDNEERRLFVSIKNNVGRPAPALAFRLGEIPVGEHQDVIAPYVVWDPEPVADTTADRVLTAARGGENRPASAEAADLLHSLLTDGPMPVELLQQEAIAAGLLKDGAVIGKDKAFRLAREKLGISRGKGAVYREGGTGAAGRWFWRLPAA